MQLLTAFESCLSDLVDSLATQGWQAEWIEADERFIRYRAVIAQERKNWRPYVDDRLPEIATAVAAALEPGQWLTSKALAEKIAPALGKSPQTLQNVWLVRLRERSPYYDSTFRRWRNKGRKVSRDTI